jgi:hypothetical protein
MKKIIFNALLLLWKHVQLDKVLILLEILVCHYVSSMIFLQNYLPIHYAFVADLIIGGVNLKNVLT